MRRGEVYDADLRSTSGSEQSGIRPVVIVGRDAINAASSVLLGVPCTTYRAGRRSYPHQVVLYAPDGGLTADSVALCGQVRALDERRFLRLRGVLSVESLAQVGRALLIALDLDRWI